MFFHLLALVLQHDQLNHFDMTVPSKAHSTRPECTQITDPRSDGPEVDAVRIRTASPLQDFDVTLPARPRGVAKTAAQEPPCKLVRRAVTNIRTV